MRPTRPLRRRLRAVLGAFALAGTGFCVLNTDNAQAQNTPSSTVDASLRGLQAVYLRAPIQRYYAGTPAETPTISPDSLELTNLTVGDNRRIYTKLDRVRSTIASDEALAVFLSNPQVGPALREALQSATLYAGMPRPGESGFNDFNALNAGIGNLRPVKRLNQGKIGGRFGAGSGSNRFGAPLSQPGNTPQAGKQPGFLGDLQRVQTQGGTGGTNGAAAANSVPAARLMAARQAILRDFTILIGLSPDGRQATLYVIGSLPDAPNSSVPINLTVEGKQYFADDTDTSGMDRASSVTVVDKQTLPAASEETRYFCYAYPLATPAHDAQSNLLVSYWMDESLALTHGVALARTNAPMTGSSNPAAQWIAIPMTRLQRYQPRRAVQYTLLTSTEVGDPILATYRTVIRKAVVNKKKGN